MKDGIFVVLEGIDGAGKTTLARLIRDKLSKQGRLVTIISHTELEYDESSYLGSKLSALRSCIWGDIDTHMMNEVPSICWTYLLSTWYILLSKHFIEEFRDHGHIVISDSWVYKRIARFSLKEDIETNHLLKCFSQVSKPDLTVLLDICPSDAWKRRDSYPAKDLGLFDGYIDSPMNAFIRYQQEIRKQLQQYSKEQEWMSLDATKDAEFLAEQVIAMIDSKAGFLD